MIKINRHPSRRQLLQFAGIWFPLFWALVGFMLYRKLADHRVAYALWGVAALVAAAGLARPAFMRYVYLGMIYVTYPIGWVVSNVLLAMVYFLVVTPIGLVMRLSGRDPMTRRFDPEASSYWIPRTEQRDVSRYFRQY